MKDGETGEEREERFQATPGGCGCISAPRMEALEKHVYDALERDAELMRQFNTCQARVEQSLEKVRRRLEAIPDAEHAQHHELLATLIRERRLRVEFWGDIRKKVATTTIVGAFGLILTALWFAFDEWVKHHITR